MPRSEGRYNGNRPFVTDLSHGRTLLKMNGKAAVVVPDNVVSILRRVLRYSLGMEGLPLDNSQIRPLLLRAEFYF